MRYIFSHYFYSGVGVSCGALGIALITYSVFDLATAVAASTGAMAVSIADVPRAAYLKRLQLSAALILAALTTLLIGLSTPSEWLQAVVILGVSFSAAMLTAYGKEALPVSMAVLIMMAIALGTPMPDSRSAFEHIALFAAGGIAYLVYGLLVSIWLRVRTKQQAIAECLYEFARYLEIKANLYESGFDLDATYRALINQQAVMMDRLQSARDLTFRGIKTAQDGQLACTLIAILDVYEYMLAAQTDYTVLRRYFSGTDVLMFLRDLAIKSAEGLDQISVAVLRDREPRLGVNYKAELYAIEHERDRLMRELSAESSDSQAVAVLTEIYDTVRRSIAQIEGLHRVARTPVEPEAVLDGANLKLFVNRFSFSPRLLFSHFRLRSPIFRYAMRTAMAMDCGYVLAKVLPYAAHSQWILLTLAVIMRPNFSLTKQRRTDRVVGNAIGCMLTAALLHASPGPVILFAGSFLAMALAHTFAPIKYRYAAAAACIMALLQLHLLDPSARFVISERLIDTLVGALLAYGFSYVLPNWEYRDLPKMAANLLEASATYASATLRLPPLDLEYRLARKRFQDTIGALSGALGRMQQEPESRQTKAELNSFITLNYLLAAHLATVRVLWQQRVGEIDLKIADQLMNETRLSVQAELLKAISLLAGNPEEEAETGVDVRDWTGDSHQTTTDWNAEVSLRQRLQRIVEEVRKLRKLSGAIALA